ncbi:MAG TPA: prepilin-type N-terminal cleavage/methylation domain-containing protein [Candidatus Dormibacteraeota bacterium]|nr:prepilin-type N-terminal cleavage/methylation domain-containing protein [Candidatus Dormibacteraeota bacterium]
MKRGWNQSGFTLVELVLALAISSLLVGGMIAGQSALRQRTNQTASIDQLKNRLEQVRTEAVSSVAIGQGKSNSTVFGKLVEFEGKSSFTVSTLLSNDDDDTRKLAKCDSEAVSLPSGLEYNTTKGKQAIIFTRSGQKVFTAPTGYTEDGSTCDAVANETPTFDKGGKVSKTRSQVNVQVKKVRPGPGDTDPVNCNDLSDAGGGTSTVKLFQTDGTDQQTKNIDTGSTATYENLVDAAKYKATFLQVPTGFLSCGDSGEVTARPENPPLIVMRIKPDCYTEQRTTPPYHHYGPPYHHYSAPYHHYGPPYHHYGPPYWHYMGYSDHYGQFDGYAYNGHNHTYMVANMYHKVHHYKSSNPGKGSPWYEHWAYHYEYYGDYYGYYGDYQGYYGDYQGYYGDPYTAPVCPP